MGKTSASHTRIDRILTTSNSNLERTTSHVLTTPEKCVRQVETPDGISWHTENFRPDNYASLRDEPEYIVLIPSGEGDCHNLSTVAQMLVSRASCQVLTFDMPGFSRTTAPVEAYSFVTPELLCEQILGLLDKLKIQKATFFGCSSGGGAALALCALHPDRVKCAVVHEVPLEKSDLLLNMLSWPDDEISKTVQTMFSTMFVEQDSNDGPRKWEALGSEYHARLAKNYVTWARNYTTAGEAWVDLGRVPENLQKRPIFWTVGGLNPGVETCGGNWKRDFEVAEAAGLTVNRERLRSLHFPAVTIPGDLTEWILECIDKVNE